MVVNLWPAACSPASAPLYCEVEPRKHTHCHDIDEPQWEEAIGERAPPVGSVGPPPDCSVPSPRSIPSTPASPTSSSALPEYFLSESCLFERLRTHRAPR